MEQVEVAVDEAGHECAAPAVNHLRLRGVVMDGPAVVAHIEDTVAAHRDCLCDRLSGVHGVDRGVEKDEICGSPEHCRDDHAHGIVSLPNEFGCKEFGALVTGNSPLAESDCDRVFRKPALRRACVANSAWFRKLITTFTYTSASYMLNEQCRSARFGLCWIGSARRLMAFIPSIVDVQRRYRIQRYTDVFHHCCIV
jgi:hypothetical protein